MKSKLLLIAAVAAGTSCSVGFDSQYGLRIEPQRVRSSGISAPNTTESASFEAAPGVPFIEVWSVEAPSTHEIRIDGPNEFEVLPTQTESVYVERSELHSTASNEIASRPDEPATADATRESIPYWVEGLLGILLALVAIALLAGSFFALLMGVLSFGFGDIALGWILIGGAIVAFILGWILLVYARPMLPELPPFLFRIPFF